MSISTARLVYVLLAVMAGVAIAQLYAEYRILEVAAYMREKGSYLCALGREGIRFREAVRGATAGLAVGAMTRPFADRFARATHDLIPRAR